MTDAALLDQLRSIDTPTVCNALERVAPERQGSGFTTRPLVCVAPQLAPIVGFARTARIRASAPSARATADELESDLAYYRYMAGAPHPTITVVEDLDDPPGLGAWWGEVHSHVHRGLGSLGVVTNGSVRDLAEFAEGFQALAGCVSPSHAFVHVVDVGTPVRVAGMTVAHDDIVHADRHGAVVIPRAVAEDVPEMARAVVRGERVLIEASRAPDFDIATLETLLRPKAH